MSYLDDELLIPITRNQLGILCHFASMAYTMFCEEDPEKQEAYLKHAMSRNLWRRMYYVDNMQQALDALMSVKAMVDLKSVTTKVRPEFKRKCKYCGKYVCLINENGKWFSYEYKDGKVLNAYHSCAEYAASNGKKRPMTVPASSHNFVDDADE